ncbi:hypothetical protein Pan189_33810 [Stratiformator vulcanicus]|uniref:Cytochrome oxidase complex assembly protein 1 n=2 Tax=Stratiformator vulcanicus TaxID=2527980 RepID=A0A517R521_9PLAN|nr:hypothetical protein Pan189_33810 [Stratiformator vulcanicus]
MDEDTFQPEPLPRKKGGKGCLIAGIILGILGLGALGLIICCGGGFYAIMGVMSQAVEEEMRQNEVIAEHVGEVTSFSFNYGDTFGGENRLIFDIEGTKAGGQVIMEVDQNAPQEEQIQGGRLILDNGDEYDLFPDGVPQFDGEVDVNTSELLDEVDEEFDPSESGSTTGLQSGSAE